MANHAPLVESGGARLSSQFTIGMVRPAAFLRLMGYALFSIPPLLLLVYLVTQFPRPQETLHIHPSLASVPRSNRVWDIYNEDYFPGGGYAVLPHGRVRLHSDRSHHMLTWIRYDTGSWAQRTGRRYIPAIKSWPLSHPIHSGCLDTWTPPPRDHLEERRPAASNSRIPRPTVWCAYPT